MPWAPTYRLYAAEFKCGVVKVGQTMQQGAKRAHGLRVKGQAPIRIHYGQKHERGWLPESLLLARMRNLGSVFQGREWFTGVRFEAASQLVEQVTRNLDFDDFRHACEAPIHLHAPTV